jgi:hypothetical protein
MDRSAYYQQIKSALAHARHKLVAYGIVLAPVNLSIIIAGFIVFQWYPQSSLTYFAIAGPVCVAALALLAIPVSTTFARYAPCCPACHRPVRLLNWRRATAARLCPHCRGALFEP